MVQKMTVDNFFQKPFKAREILTAYGMELFRDLQETPDSTEDAPKASVCYYIGWPDGAGIIGGVASPLFATAEEACDWVVNNEDELAEL